MAVGVGCLLVAVGAQAQTSYTSTDRPGSILMFPKVVRDGTRDTIIQITNTGNNVNSVYCQYVNGEATRTGAPLCSLTDFELLLTRQQPTQWSASAGRQVLPGDAPGSSGAGFDPGLIPPLPEGFTGALVCAEVMPDGSQAPYGQNRLKGEATLVSAGGDVSKYNATAIPAIPDVGTDNVLSLNNAEYGRCASQYRLNFIPGGAPDPVIDAYGMSGVSSVETGLTLLPCDLDFRNGLRGGGTMGVLVWDEFETRYSGSFPYACWTNLDLRSLAIGRSAVQPGGSIQTLFANAQLTATSPVVGVAESLHVDSMGTTGSAAVNLFQMAETANAAIRLP